VSDQDRYARALAFFSFLLVVVAVIQASIYGLQLIAFVLNERGWLVVANVRFPRGEPIAANGVIFLGIKNAGKTVAVTKELNLSVSLSNGRSLPDNSQYTGRTEDYVQAIAPGDEFNLRGIASNPGELTPEIVSALLNGDGSFHVFGFLK